MALGIVSLFFLGYGLFFWAIGFGPHAITLDRSDNPHPDLYFMDEPSTSYIGLQLGEVAEIEAQMFGFVQNFNRRTAVEFSTEPAILPNCF
jgi:hypothetical protein